MGRSACVAGPHKPEQVGSSMVDGPLPTLGLSWIWAGPYFPKLNLRKANLFIYVYKIN